MATLHQGGCRCGAARYEIDLSGAHTIVCHCTDCKKHLGAPYSIFTVVPTDRFRWLAKPSGEVAFSEAVDRLFCGTCGTYLKWQGHAHPEEAEINAMTLDDPTVVTVDEEIFTRSRLPWIMPIAGVPQYENGERE